jgi:hypothetical protein
VPTKSLPIWNALRKILDANLVIFSAAPETPFRARSVRGTRHSVTVADGGSNPAGSILPVVEEKLRLEERNRDISSSNLTLVCRYPILNWTECLTLRFFLNGPASAGPFVFWVLSVSSQWGNPQPTPASARPYRTGAGVPSDHLPAGIMNTSIGSGAPPNCGFSMTGELGRSAPQTAPSMSGV